MHAGPPTRLLVTVATYNERDNILRLIADIHRYVPAADILVVDDNSPDGTGQAVDERARTDPRVTCLHRAGKLGLGTAILVALTYARDRGYDLVVNMDADFSHPPQCIPAMVAGMDRADVMIGSRYVPGGGTVNWPRSRKAMSLGVNGLVRLLFRLGVRDASGGFRCYRVAKLADVPFDRIISRGYSFQQEMLYRCHRAGCRLGETPIVFEDRKVGKSKVSWKESARSLAMIVYLGVRAFLGLDRRRAI